MAELTDREFEEATERGRRMFETEPHARSARFDRRTGLLTLELYNGGTYSVPARQLQGLSSASDVELEKVEVVGFGYGLHWETLDADFTVPGLLNGRFGTARFMASQHERLRAILTELENGRRSAAA
jgi:hypothetical protein